MDDCTGVLEDCRYGNSKGTVTYPPDPKVIHDRANDSSEEVTVQQQVEILQACTETNTTSLVNERIILHLLNISSKHTPGYSSLL
jgi:hypothetical protein